MFRIRCATLFATYAVRSRPLEPGEEAARNHQLFPAIIHMLGRNTFNSGLFDQICDLLDSSSIRCKSFVVNLMPIFDIISVNPIFCPENAIAILCTASRTPDLEVSNQVSLGTAIVALLKHKHFQNLAIMQDDLISILDLIVFSYTQGPVDVTESGKLTDMSAVHEKQETEGEELLSNMRQSLSSSLWDLSSLPEFATKYLFSPPCNSDCLSAMLLWLRTSEPQMQLCACYVFRNLAASDKACGMLVQESKIHTPLINILESSSDLPVLGEVLRLLKNLALPTENKPLIGSGTAIDSLTKCWSRLSSPTLHQAAVGLFRILMRGCPSNIVHFLGLHSARDAFATSTDGSLSRLWSLYKSSTDPAIKVEVARSVVEIWRTAHKEVPESVSSVTEGMIEQARRMHANIAEPVVVMIVESNNASLVSDGWFGLTLMASSKDGSEIVSEALSAQNAWDILIRTVSGQEVGLANRANSRLLLDKLRKHNVSLGVFPNWRPGPALIISTSRRIDLVLVYSRQSSDDLSYSRADEPIIRLVMLKMRLKPIRQRWLHQVVEVTSETS